MSEQNCKAPTKLVGGPAANCAVLGDTTHKPAGLILAQSRSVDRLVDRLLPYFSIALNTLLLWHLMASANHVPPVAYGTKYVSLILRALEISFL
jgi:hypothetical protein